MSNLKTVANALHNAETIKANAVMYERYKDELAHIHPNTISELTAYIEREYNALPCNVIFAPVEFDCPDMQALYKQENTLQISSLYNNSPLFPGELNLKFRAIHDYAHILHESCGDYSSELAAYLHQSRGLSYEAKQVLYSEIVLQACYALYNGRFAPVQKVVLTAVPNPKD